MLRICNERVVFIPECLNIQPKRTSCNHVHGEGTKRPEESTKFEKTNIRNSIETSFHAVILIGQRNGRKIKRICYYILASIFPSFSVKVVTRSHKLSTHPLISTDIYNFKFQ
jgi:hypothetical protein